MLSKVFCWGAVTVLFMQSCWAAELMHWYYFCCDAKLQPLLSFSWATELPGYAGLCCWPADLLIWYFWPFSSCSIHIQQFQTCTAIYSHLQPFPAIYSHLQPFSAIFRYFQQLSAIFSHVQTLSDIFRLFSHSSFSCRFQPFSDYPPISRYVNEFQSCSHCFLSAVLLGY